MKFLSFKKYAGFAFVLSFAFSLFIPLNTHKSLAVEENITEEFRSDRILVKFKKDKLDLKEKRDDQFGIASEGLNRSSDIIDSNITVFEVKDKNIDEVISELSKKDEVEYVQKDYAYTSAVISTNDTYKGQMWALDNTGQAILGEAGTKDADVDAPESWSIYSGSTNEVVVGVIDSGTDFTHPDLASEIWNGSKCKDENGNTLGGCKGGYDFKDDDSDPYPDVTDSKNRNHGTHVSGIIAATGNNKQGMLGIAPNARIMGLRSALYSSEIIRAISFAKFNGVKIINASWGGTSFDEALEESIKNFPGLFIAASHNQAKNVDTNPVYPCNYDLANIICVGSTDNNDKLSSFSNYGVKSVDIAAPGTAILSTVAFPSGDIKYEYYNGTSMATPYVAGAAAYLWGYKPNLTKEEIKSVILSSADTKTSLNGKVSASRRLNVLNAVKTLQNSTALYRFWSLEKQGHFYTANPLERDSVINTDRTWDYEGVAYYITAANSAGNCTVSGKSRVYRFWNATDRHHFYTINEAEKDSIIKNDKKWSYEGVAFCADRTQVKNSKPVYRFFSTDKVSHFYTINPAEKDNLISNDKSWKFEGIAYYAFTR